MLIFKNKKMKRPSSLTNIFTNAIEAEDSVQNIFKKIPKKNTSFKAALLTIKKENNCSNSDVLLYGGKKNCENKERIDNFNENYKRQVKFVKSTLSKSQNVYNKKKHIDETVGFRIPIEHNISVCSLSEVSSRCDNSTLYTSQSNASCTYSRNESLSSNCTHSAEKLNKFKEKMKVRHNSEDGISDKSSNNILTRKHQLPQRKVCRVKSILKNRINRTCIPVERKKVRFNLETEEETNKNVNKFFVPNFTEEVVPIKHQSIPEKEDGSINYSIPYIKDTKLQQNYKKHKSEVKTKNRSVINKKEIPDYKIIPDDDYINNLKEKNGYPSFNVSNNRSLTREESQQARKLSWESILEDKQVKYDISFGNSHLAGPTPGNIMDSNAVDKIDISEIEEDDGTPIRLSPEISNIDYNTDRYENLGVEDQYKLLINRLIRCPKEELLSFLKDFSSAISLNDGENNIQLKNHLSMVLGSLINRISSKNENQCPKKVRISDRKKTDNQSKYKVNRSSKSIKLMKCSSSSVTSISSSGAEGSLYKYNIKDVRSMKVLKQCMEQTFCSNNSSCEDLPYARTEFKNYSRSSSSSDNCNVLNGINKLTSLLEELNIKVDKIASKENYIYENTGSNLNIDEMKVEGRGQEIYNSYSNELEKGEKPYDRAMDAVEFLEVIKDKTACIENSVQTESASEKEHLNVKQENCENKGFILYSQSGSGLFLKVTENNISEDTQITDYPEEVKTKLQLNRSEEVQNKINDQENVLVSPLSKPEIFKTLSINESDVQEIIKHLTGGINGMKLTSPSLYKSPNKKICNKKTDYAVKDVTQSFQKSIHGFIQAIFKLIPHKIKKKSKRQKNKTIKQQKKEHSDATILNELVQIFFPFCKPNGESDEEGVKISSKNKHDNEHLTESESKASITIRSSSEYWPDIRRTRYPNGMIHFGPLLRIPEPYISVSETNLTENMKHNYSSSSLQETIYEKCRARRYSIRKFSSDHSKTEMETSYDSVQCNRHSTSFYSKWR